MCFSSGVLPRLSFWTESVITVPEALHKETGYKEKTVQHLWWTTTKSVKVIFIECNSINWAIKAIILTEAWLCTPRDKDLFIKVASFVPQEITRIIQVRYYSYSSLFRTYCVLNISINIQLTLSVRSVCPYLKWISSIYTFAKS